MPTDISKIKVLISFNLFSVFKVENKAVVIVMLDKNNNAIDILVEIKLIDIPKLGKRL